MDKYRQILNQTSGIADWTATRFRVQEAQRYLIGNRTESVRLVNRAETSIVIYVDHDGQRGRARLALMGSDSELTVDVIERSVFAAGLQSNPPFSLPPPGNYPAVELADPVLTRDAQGAMAELEKELLKAVAKEPGVKLSAAEFFVEYGEVELASSLGADTSKTETSLNLELVLLAGEGDKEAESYGAYTVRRLTDLPIEEIVARQARFARDRVLAEPTPEYRGPIVLTQGCFLPLFEPLRTATSARSVHSKMSVMALGDSLLGKRKVNGDHLTMINDPNIPFAMGSSPFDDQGLALAPVTVIEDNVVKAFTANQRYSDYLGVPALGDWTNTRVPAGQTPLSELLAADDGPVLEIVEFSWLNPDKVRGRFSTEVRLAYLHGPEGPRPVRGGAFAGNVYDLFSNARFASETELRKSYHGPVAIRFEGSRITGG